MSLTSQHFYDKGSNWSIVLIFCILLLLYYTHIKIPLSLIITKQFRNIEKEAKRNFNIIEKVELAGYARNSWNHVGS